jgi:hypothetical protein
MKTLQVWQPGSCTFGLFYHNSQLTTIPKTKGPVISRSNKIQIKAHRINLAMALLLDFAMVVFSLAVLRANLRGEPTLYPWVLTGAYAGLATIGNILDVSGLSIPQEFEQDHQE